MNLVEYRKIKSAAESLRDSMYLRIESGAVAVSLNGRCRTAVSRRTVEFQPLSASSVKALIIFNNRCALGFSSAPFTRNETALIEQMSADLSGKACRPAEALVPRSIFGALFAEVEELGFSAPAAELVNVLFALPVVDSWEYRDGAEFGEGQAGRWMPVFRPLPAQTEEDSALYEVRVPEDAAMSLDNFQLVLDFAAEHFVALGLHFSGRGITTVRALTNLRDSISCDMAKRIISLTIRKATKDVAAGKRPAKYPVEAALCEE